MTEEVTGDWRKFDNEELRDLYRVTKYYLGDQTKMNESGRACSTCVCVCVCVREREERELHTALFFWDGGGPERMAPLGIPKRRWDNNIKVNLKEIEWESMDRIVLPQDRDKWQVLVNTDVNLQVP